MDDPLNSFDWNHVRAFLATAETGSLSAAARRLRLTQPTLGRQVSALEAELGVTLFERVGRRLEITTAGQDLLGHVRRMGEAAAHVSLMASGQSQAIDGTVRITASDVFSAHLMPDILHRLRQVAPRLRVELVATNDIADLLRREADIAIRHVRPEQPDLIARMLAEARGHFYAARNYLDARGRPKAPQDLALHDWVGFGDNRRMIDYMAPMGIPLTEENFRSGSENGLVALELIRRGFGIGPMAETVGQAIPELEIVLPDLPPLVFPVWLVTHRELHTSRRIRLVFDLIADSLKALRPD